MNEEKKGNWNSIDEKYGNRPVKKEKDGAVMSIRGQSTEIGQPIDVRATRKEPEGIVARMQHQKVTRKAELAALKMTFDSQLDALQHKLVKACIVEKAKADVMAEEFLKELDAKHLQVLSELGLRNKETREKSLIKLTETTVERIKEVNQKDWPDFLIEETIKEILALRKRALTEIMDELGQGKD